MTLRNLTDCTVYLLDYASEVEVFHCVNCQIFIGPVDGPALFQDCSNCHVAVASQQFQAKGCNNCSFGLYCATGPTLSQCTGIRISCWSGSYYGLDRHFACAHLDPSKNQFDKVYDASQVEGENYKVSMEPGEPWVVDVPGLEEQQPVAVAEPEEEQQPVAAPEEEKREEMKPVENDWIKAKHHPGRNDDDVEDGDDVVFSKEQWRKTVDFIDFGSNSGRKSDLQRFKSVLLSLCNNE